MKLPNNLRTVCTKIIKTIAHNTKQRRPRFRKTSKAVSISIEYRQTSQTQDVKNQCTKRSLRKIAQPKRDSALEQKTRIVSCREISASSQNGFFLHPKNQAKQSSKRHFWNVLNVVLESFCFAQETKAVFISIRYPKASQTQDVKSQSTKCSLREMAQPKCDSAFEQKTRIIPRRETSGSSQNNFCSYNQRKQQSRAQTDILEPTQRRFGKLVFSFW